VPIKYSNIGAYLTKNAEKKYWKYVHILAARENQGE
jgi:hypothetical protein